MALQFGNAKPKLMYGNSKVKLMYGSTKLYSSGSAVSYYDGATLIGTLDVDEGLDVLHPDLPLSKEGYTLVGWQYNDERVETLAADGEAMTLYAIYLPNTLVVAQGDVGTVWYTPQIKDERYISGSIGSEKKVSSGNDFVSCTFTVDPGMYQTVSGTTRVNGSGSGWHQSDVTPSITSGGTYTVSSIFVGNNGTYTCVVGVNQITLSNPRAWT